MSACPVHKVLRHLREFAGLPVPYIVKWVSGKPDFRDAEPSAWADCLKRRACGVCGKALGEWCFYIGGPQSAKSGLFTDPPMHGTCAAESIKLCPFLNRTRPTYRGYKPHSSFQTSCAERPGTMHLLRGRTKNLALCKLPDDQVVIYSGKIETVRTF
jgi:hypothetical protein